MWWKKIFEFELDLSLAILLSADCGDEDRKGRAGPFSSAYGAHNFLSGQRPSLIGASGPLCGSPIVRFRPEADIRFFTRVTNLTFDFDPVCHDRPHKEGKSMQKAINVLAAVCAIVLFALPAYAQNQKKSLPRIGFLHTRYALGSYDRAFLKGLNDLGYFEGKTIVVEHRFAREGGNSRLRALASELARLKVDVIVALVPAAARAAAAATREIPIVVRFSRDPVAEGLVKSLGKPGGNITGVTSIAQELTAKRIELLKELVPGLTRIGVMWNPESRRTRKYFATAEAVSRKLSVEIRSMPIRGAEDFASAFRTAVNDGLQGFITFRNPIIVRHRTNIAALATQNRLPGVYDEREFVKAGGLISYGTSLSDLYRHAAIYVDKIIRGAKPADLPVEQPTKFDLVVNLRTAKALGITVPLSILLRADEIVE